MGIDDFIGNADQIDKMVAWLNDYYCGNRKIKFVLIVAVNDFVDSFKKNKEE